MRGNSSKHYGKQIQNMMRGRKMNSRIRPIPLYERKRKKLEKEQEALRKLNGFKDVSVILPNRAYSVKVEGYNDNVYIIFTVEYQRGEARLLTTLKNNNKVIKEFFFYLGAYTSESTIKFDIIDEMIHVSPIDFEEKTLNLHIKNTINNNIHFCLFIDLEKKEGIVTEPFEDYGFVSAKELDWSNEIQNTEAELVEKYKQKLT